MGLTVHFEVLNQLGTPMMYSATLANRPAAGITGRIFFRTDSPYGIFRDTGSAWDQISGASTFSGSLATGQVAFGSATNTISGTNNLFWDNANGRLGIGLNTPVTTLDVYGNATFKSASVNNSTLTLLTNTTGSYFQVTGGTSSTRIFGVSAIETRLQPSIGFDPFFTMYNTSGAETIRISATGVSRFNNAFSFILGSAADTGQKFQVYGDTLLKGTGSTSATTALIIQDSAGNSFVRAVNSQILEIGTTDRFQFSSARMAHVTSGGSISNFQIVSGSVAMQYSTINVGTNSYNSGVAFSDTWTRTIITQSFGSYVTFNPTSGSTTYCGFESAPTINQTGGANGITRGLYIRPTLTAASDWRSIQWDNNSGWGLYGAGTALNYLGGSLGIKTTAPYQPSTFSLDINGGLLIKNTAGTTAQMTLINADPSIGGNNGFLVNTVGGTSGSSYVDLQGYYGTSITGSTALRLNPAGGPVIINSTTNSGEQIQITGTIRVNGQTSGTAGGNSGQHLIINCDGTTYKIALLNP